MTLLEPDPPPPVEANPALELEASIEEPVEAVPPPIVPELGTRPTKPLPSRSQSSINRHSPGPQIIPPGSPMARSAMDAYVHDVQLRTTGEAGKDTDLPGSKVRRRLQLQQAFDGRSQETAEGRQVKVTELLAALADCDSVDPMLPSYFRHYSSARNGESGEEPQMTWDQCLSVLQNHEPRATAQGATDAAAADDWFERGRATILMDVSVQNHQFELKINDDCIPEVCPHQWLHFPTLAGPAGTHVTPVCTGGGNGIR